MFAAGGTVGQMGARIDGRVAKVRDDRRLEEQWGVGSGGGGVPPSQAGARPAAARRPPRTPAVGLGRADRRPSRRGRRLCVCVSVCQSRSERVFTWVRTAEGEGEGEGGCGT